ncbi:MAG: hypothetical protein Rubg2KO_13790 [Rubricoccaceae bacterium]
MDNPLLVYSAYLLAIVSLLGNYVQYRIRRRDEARTSLRDKRYSAYSDYFNKVDRANSQLYLTQHSQEVQDELQNFMSLLARVSAGNGTPDDAILINEQYGLIMQNQLAAITSWVREQNVLLDEVNKLKLIASPEVASILARYSAVVEEALSSSAGLPVEMALSGPGATNWDLLLDYGQIQDKLKAVKAELHQAMRKDIGVE